MSYQLQVGDEIRCRRGFQNFEVTECYPSGTVSLKGTFTHTPVSLFSVLNPGQTPDSNHKVVKQLRDLPFS